jgi:hypothetical protein
LWALFSESNRELSTEAKGTRQEFMCSGES